MSTNTITTLLICFGFFLNLSRYIRYRRLGELYFLLFWILLGLAVFMGIRALTYLSFLPLIAGIMQRRKDNWMTVKKALAGSGSHNTKSSPALETAEDDREQGELKTEGGTESKEATNIESPEDFIMKIPSAADSCVKTVESMFGRTLNYHESDFEVLDEIITEAWAENPPTLIDPLVISVGSYVGECIRRNVGGEWAYTQEYSYHLKDVGNSDTKIFPFSKVRKRLTEGEDDSLAFYYAALKHVLSKETDGS